MSNNVNFVHISLSLLADRHHELASHLRLHFSVSGCSQSGETSRYIDLSNSASTEARTRQEAGSSRDAAQRQAGHRRPIRNVESLGSVPKKRKSRDDEFFFRWRSISSRQTKTDSKFSDRQVWDSESRKSCCEQTPTQPHIGHGRLQVRNLAKIFTERRWSYSVLWRWQPDPGWGQVGRRAVEDPGRVPEEVILRQGDGGDLWKLEKKVWPCTTSHSGKGDTFKLCFTSGNMLIFKCR